MTIDQFKQFKQAVINFANAKFDKALPEEAEEKRQTKSARPSKKIKPQDRRKALDALDL